MRAPRVLQPVQVFATTSCHTSQSATPLAPRMKANMASRAEVHFLSSALSDPHSAYVTSRPLYLMT